MLTTISFLAIRMDVLITIIRFPLAIVAGWIVLVFWSGCFILETVFAIITLPVLAVTGKRSQIKNSWLSTYPNSSPIINTLKAWKKLADWVSND
jgi:hypothetical protein